MGKTTIAFLSVAGLLIGAVECLAHGTVHAVTPGGTVVQARYDDGSPMAFCDVSVFEPGNDKNPYQTGSTDPKGNFAFLPGTNGIWRVRVDDGMGHTVLAEVYVGATGLEESSHSRGVRRVGGGLVGVSLIFGIFGVYCLFRHRPHRTRGKTAPQEGKA